MAIIRSFSQPTVEARPIPNVAVPAGPGIVVSPQAEGQARDMLVAGQQFDRAAANVDKILVEEKAAADETRVQDLSNQFVTQQQKALYTAPDAFYRQRGEAAIHAAEPTAAKLLEIKKALLDQAGNDTQRRELGKRLDFQVADATNGISRHVATQSLVWQDAVSKGTVANAQNQAALDYNDPGKVAVHLDGAAQTEYARTLKATGSPEAATAAAKAVTSNGYKSVISLMAVDDPVKAQKFMDANRDKLDAADAPVLAATIKGAALHRQAQNIVSLVTSTGGVSADYDARVAKSEGGSSSTVENKIGALGKYQFIPSTYTSLGQQTEWGKGKSQAEIRALLLDPKEGVARQDELQKLNRGAGTKALAEAGVPVNDMTLKTTHFLGTGAGPAILKLPDDTPLQAGLLKAHGGDAAFVQKVNEANPFLAKVQTVGDLKALMAQAVGAPRSLSVSGTPEKPNLDAMLQAGLTLAGSDPDLRDKVVSGIKADYATKHALYTQQIGALQKQALTHIDNGGSIDTLPPAVRAGLDSDGLLKVQAYEEKRIEKRRKEGAETASKSLTDLMVLGQLTPEDVTKVRDFLPHAEYLSWQRTASGKERLDDPNAYERLQRGLGTRDMRDDIFSAHTSGDISSETRNAFLDKNATFMKEGAPATPYRIGHDYVMRSLDPGLVGSGISRQTSAAAIKEFDQYVAANPQREGETPEAFAKRVDIFSQDVVKRYSLVNTQDMAVSLPVPANTTFNRSLMTTLPKPEAQRKIVDANMDLQKRFAAGQITEDQYNADAVALLRWLDFVDKRTDPAPATKK